MGFGDAVMQSGEERQGEAKEESGRKEKEKGGRK